MTVLCMYSIQWSLSTRDKYDGIMYVQYTVEPLYKGHIGGVPWREVVLFSEVHYGKCMGITFVGCPRFHCIYIPIH